MRPYITTPITSLEDAHEFFRELHKDDCLFHPEDDPDSVIDSDEMPIFTAEEADLIRQRIAEVYVFDNDPCAFILTLS